MAIIHWIGFNGGGTTGSVQPYGEYATQSSDTASKSSYVTSPVYSGQHAWRVNSSSDSTNAWISLRLADATTGRTTASFNQTTVYSFVRFRVATFPTTNAVPFFNSQCTTPALDHRLLVTSSGLIEVWSGDDALTTKELTSTDSLSANTWHIIELNLYGTTGELKIDGTSQGTWTRTADTITHNTIGCATGTPTETWDFYWDLAVASTTDLSSNDYRCHRLYPNAAGAETAWSGTYADVDDHPCDEGTTISSSSTQTNSVAWALDAATGTVGGSDTVHGVQVSWVMRKSAAPALGMVLYINSGTVKHDAYTLSNELNNGWDTGNSDLNTFGKLYLTDPETSSEWTISDLDGLEIGATHDQAQSRQIDWSAAGADVLYEVPGAASPTGKNLLTLGVG